MVQPKKYAQKFILLTFYKKITVDEVGVDEIGVDKMGSRRKGNKPAVKPWR